MNPEDRISTLENKVDSLELEISQLKMQLSKLSNTAQHPILNQTSFAFQKDSSNKLSEVRPLPENNPKISLQNTGGRPVPENKAKASAIKKGNLETAIGKNVIGILASILFFIAFIVFGSFIYKNLGNMGKSVLLFGGSFLITGIGLLLQKKLKNAFSLSVIGCGMGCFYITLIINTIYFEFLTELGLYSLLLIWLLGMSLLSKKYESTLLCIIGQCGLYLSILFGVTNKTLSETLWFSFFVFFLVADIFYLRICSVEKRENLHVFSTIGTIISCLLIASRNYNLFLSYIEEKNTIIGFIVIYLAIILILCAYSLYHFHKTAKRGMLQSKSFPTFLAAIYFFCVIDIYNKAAGIIRFGFGTSLLFIHIIEFFFYVGIMFYLIVFIEKFTDRKFTNFISILNLPVVILLLMDRFKYFHLDDYSLLLLLAVPLLFYGFYKGKKIYQVLGFFVFFLHFWTGYQHELLHFFLTMASFFLIIRLQKKYLESYSGITKVFIYIFFLIYCFLPADELDSFLRQQDFTYLSTSILYVLFLTPFQVFALKSNFIKNYKDTSKTEKYMEFFVRAGNILLLFIGVPCLYDSLSVWVYLLLVIATSILCFLGIRQFMERHCQKLWSGFYIGIKITIYLTAVFYSTPISNKILFSILLLCIAIIAILTGFKLNLKSLRIYGLGLTMMSVVKLILFDVDYSSTLGTVAALMVCGVLCFIINFIYNMLSKHIVTVESEKEES